MKVTHMETTFCNKCGTHHVVEPPGLFKGCGVLCSLATLAARKHPGLALGLFVGSLVFGDAVERWVRARCPECGAALQLLASIQRVGV